MLFKILTSASGYNIERPQYYVCHVCQSHIKNSFSNIDGIYSMAYSVLPFPIAAAFLAMQENHGLPMQLRLNGKPFSEYATREDDISRTLQA